MQHCFCLPYIRLVSKKKKLAIPNVTKGIQIPSGAIATTGQIKDKKVKIIFLGISLEKKKIEIYLNRVLLVLTNLYMKILL